jgi:Fe2+ or Zn2+ uptake regulation protein
VLTALQSAHGPLTVAQIHRRVADDDRALARRTIDVALVALRSAGLVARAEARPGLAARWSVTPAPENRAEEDR